MSTNHCKFIEIIWHIHPIIYASLSLSFNQTWMNVMSAQCLHYIMSSEIKQFYAPLISGYYYAVYNMHIVFKTELRY